ncbi:MAG TPA: RICIN domain-containing protein [Rhizomicrobium sp.]|nr:RICIN domain-containing protein [Rhizomicrobium sp.]
MAVVLILLGTPAFAQNEVGATLSTAATKSLVKKQALVESATSNQSAIGAPVYTQSPPVIPNSIVRIRAWGTNKCLSFDGSPQHNASFSDCNDSQNNYMKILLPNPFNSSLVEFQHAWSGLCLQSPSLGGQMGAASCSAQAARFTLQSQSNAPTEFILSSYVPGDSNTWCMYTAPAGGPAHQGGCTGSYREMYLERTDTVRLRHEANGRCIYPGGGGGQPIKAWGCWQDPAMAVRLEYLGGSDVRIQFEKPMQCLYMNNNTNGGTVPAWGCGNDPNMVWVREDLGNNRVRFHHKLTNACLYTDVPGTDGQVLKHYPCGSDPNFIWVVDPF